MGDTFDELRHEVAADTRQLAEAEEQSAEVLEELGSKAVDPAAATHRRAVAVEARELADKYEAEAEWLEQKRGD